MLPVDTGYRGSRNQKSPVLRNRADRNAHTLKPGVGQNIAMYATLAAIVLYL